VWITPADLESALAAQRESGMRTGDALVAIGALSSLQLARHLAAHLKVPFVDLDHDVPDPTASAHLAEEVARRYESVPIGCHDGRLFVAMANPNDVFMLDDVRIAADLPVVPVMADSRQVSRALDLVYGPSDYSSVLEDAPETDDDSIYDVPDAFGMREAIDTSDAPVVRVVASVLERAAIERASDIHIEPDTRRVRVRFRIDGVLHDSTELPLATLRPIVSRLKVMSQLDIAQTRLPQDGRFSISVADRTIDVRVATLPSAAGEAVVLRLLDPTRGVLEVDALRFDATARERFLRACHAPQGTVLVTGPTGSGKTTTLYAVLQQINTPERAIVSVEDPVEYRLDGIKQIPINRRAGMTFPHALRSILRADPDVVLVGEIRDHETARITAEAATTGHLVFSTLHTTSAAAAPLRIIDMGVESYLVASALSCVVAQRLARRLCSCATIDRDHRALLGLGVDPEMLDGSRVRAPVGCGACQQTGYRGRFGLYEVIVVTETITRAIASGVTSTQLEALAVAEGTVPLRELALARVLSGDLSVAELIRVVT
jgi:type IV pilus assembly protein PilB